MTRQQRFRHACAALCALATLLVATGAEAQRRRMPVRTEEIPDTESGRPAASASNPTFKGRMVIFGPPSLPVTPPPEHLAPKEETVAKPPAPVIAAPAAVPVAPAPTPAPVITPTTPVAPPVAVPIPAPAPAPVAAPTPPPAPAAPVAVPAPVVKPAPPVVAAPPPAPVVSSPAPAPPPAAIAAPAPAPAPVPKPAPAAPRQEVAMAAPSSAAAAAAAAPAPIEARLIEGIFHCLSPGLPQDWKKAWVEITDAGTGKEKNSKFFFTNQYGDDEGEPLTPCSAQAITRSIVSLDDKLPPDRRAWTRARLVIDSEGDYELSYDYPK